MRKKMRGQLGFTFIELMIALVVITLVLVNYVGANVIAQRNAEEMHERTLAIQDANRVIERMRDASRTGVFPQNVTAVYPQGDLVTGFGHLTNEQVAVTYADPTSNPLSATVSVTWLSYAGRQNTEAVETYITQR